MSTASTGETAPLLCPPHDLEASTPPRSGSSATLCNGSSNDGCNNDDTASTSTIVRQESALLVRATVPLALAYLLQFSFNMINILSLGHIGASELAAAALGNMTLFMLVNAPAVGLASALDTLCATAFTAARDKTLVGFHLQRGLIAVTVHLALVLPALLRLEPILVALRQDPEIARLCGAFVRAQLLGTAPWMYFECVKRYLQAQGHMKAGTLVLLAVLPVHLANNYLLVWSPTYGMGFQGAAVANVISFWLMLGGAVGYVWRSDARHAWGGWTWRAPAAMREYYRLAIPTMIMVCSDWAAWELLAIAASYLGSVPLAAQTIVINTCSLTYQIPAGLSIAIANRAGNLLGQARARRSQISSATGILLGALAAVLNSAFCLAVAGWWGRVYSSDEDVVAIVALIMPICALFQLSDAVNGVSAGVLRALGRQAAGAWVNFPAYYAIGFPLGLFLTYGPPALGVSGLWIGICVGVTIAAAGQTAICACADYAEEVARCLAQVRKSQGFAIAS